MDSQIRGGPVKIVSGQSDKRWASKDRKWTVRYDKRWTSKDRMWTVRYDKRWVSKDSKWTVR